MSEVQGGVAARSAGRTVLLAVVVGLGLVALVVVLAVQAAAEERRVDAAVAQYTSAFDTFERALDDAREASSAEAAALADTNAAVTEADALLAVAEDGFVAAAPKGDLVLATDHARTVLATVPPESALTDLKSTVVKPRVTDDLLDAAASFEEAADLLATTAAERSARAAELSGAADGTETAGELLLTSLPAEAEALIASYTSATNDARIALREAAAMLTAPVELGTASATTVSTYVAQAKGLQASHAAEEAEKAGALYERRKVVEDFARSIAGGVMLDFDWAPIVNGFGDGGSHGGTATWNTAHGGFSTITLSDSIARTWGQEPFGQAVTVHEVGHAMTGKCYELFSTEFGSDNEVWATAWAIGMGYDVNGSGESLYGRPSDELIALSTQCR